MSVLESSGSAGSEPLPAATSVTLSADAVINALAVQGIALAPARAERLARGLSLMLAAAAADRQQLQAWMAQDDDALSWQAAALACQRTT